MKSKQKVLDLMKRGLSKQTISKLTEQDLDTLYGKLLIEQPTVVTQTTRTYKIPNADAEKGTNVNIDGKNVNVVKTPTGVEVRQSASEGEMREDMEDSMNFEKGQRTQQPHQVGPSTDDGFGNYGDGTGEVGEGRKKKKKKKYNPWAICTSQLSSEFGTSERSEWTKPQMKKYERCVMDVKKSLKEGKNPVSLFLEQQLTKIVMKHLPPKMTKGDLIKMINEAPAAPAVKPAKPTTKPETKPKQNPFKNPNPGENPAPKAVSPEDAKEKVIDVIMNILQNN